jgi:hypothetical protein
LLFALRCYDCHGSYVRITDDDDDKIVEVKEKVKISDWANSGCYCFRSGEELESECRNLLAKGEQQLSQDKVCAKVHASALPTNPQALGGAGPGVLHVWCHRGHDCEARALQGTQVGTQ